MDAAREALIGFFSALYEGRFEAAAPLYAGNYDELGGYDPIAAGEPLSDYWERICQQYLCLPIAEIAEGAQLAEDEVRFYAAFMWEDGRRLEIGACCGASPAEFPPVWQFAYPVKLIDGSWRVTRGPLYIP